VSYAHYDYALNQTLQSYCHYSSQCLPIVSYDESIAYKIMTLAQALCALQAQTFLTEESQNSIVQVNASLGVLWKEYLGFDFDAQWRFLIGIAVTFYEWCMDTGFFLLSLEEEKKRLLQESPLFSFHCFTTVF
jgi:hypothetical protein